MDTRRRGLGGLTREKKALLKKIIMEKVKEEMHEEALRKKEEKEQHIKSKIPGLPTLKGMTKDKLTQLCLELQKKISLAESEKYDIERKINAQESDINELHMQIQLKGKFVKPILRRVNKSDTSKTRAIREKKGGHFEDFSKVLTNHVEPDIEV